MAISEHEADERIEQLTVKIFKLSKALFGAAEELEALAKWRGGVSVPCSLQLLAAHAAIAGVLRPDEEPSTRVGGN